MRKSTQRQITPLFVALNRTFGLKDRSARRNAAAHYYASLEAFRAKFTPKRAKLVQWVERELERTLKAHVKTTGLPMPPVDLADALAVVEARAEAAAQ